MSSKKVIIHTYTANEKYKYYRSLLGLLPVVIKCDNVIIQLMRYIDLKIVYNEHYKGNVASHNV